jgi:hypothetical protein
VCGDDASSLISVFEWFKLLEGGRQDHQNDQEAGIDEPLELQTELQMVVKW